MVARVVPAAAELATCSPRQPGALLLAHGSPLDPEPRRPSAPPSPPALAAPSALSARSPPPLLPPTPPPLSTGGPRGYDASKPADGDPAAPRFRPIGRLRCGRHARAAWSHCGACSQHGSTALHPWSTVTRAVQRLYGFRPSARPEVPMSLLVLRARPLRWLVITHPSDPAGSPPPSRSVSGAAC